MLRLTQRSFCFGGGIQITVACRQAPDELSRLTLTLQNDDTLHQQHAEVGGDGGTATEAGGMPHVPHVPDLIGLDLWPASTALCQYLVSNPHVVSGQAVLELGSGESTTLALVTCPLACL
jgi:hypothetical protein